MSESKEIMRRYFVEFSETKDLDLIDELLADDYVTYTPMPGLGNDREANMQMLAMYAEALSDFEVTLEDVLAEGDLAAARWTVRATHQGELMGVAPTGERVEISGHTIIRIRDGKITEEWNIADVRGLMTQIGAVAAPETV